MAANQRDLSFLLEAEKYLASLPSTYKKSEGVGTSETEASRILSQEGIGSARDIISTLGLTSARDIISKENQQTDVLLNKQQPVTPPPTTAPVPGVSSDLSSSVSTTTPDVSTSLPKPKLTKEEKKKEADLALQKAKELRNKKEEDRKKQADLLRQKKEEEKAKKQTDLLFERQKEQEERDRLEKEKEAYKLKWPDLTEKYFKDSQILEEELASGKIDGGEYGKRWKELAATYQLEKEKQRQQQLLDDPEYVKKLEVEKNRQAGIFDSINKKRQAILSDPAQVELAKKQYGNQVEQTKNVLTFLNTKTAEVPTSADSAIINFWLAEQNEGLSFYGLLNETERLLYNNLSLDERLLYDEQRQKEMPEIWNKIEQQLEEKKKLIQIAEDAEKNHQKYLENLAKGLSPNAITFSIETPKFGKIDLSTGVGKTFYRTSIEKNNLVNSELTKLPQNPLAYEKSSEYEKEYNNLKLDYNIGLSKFYKDNPNMPTTEAKQKFTENYVRETGYSPSLTLDRWVNKKIRAEIDKAESSKKDVIAKNTSTYAYTLGDYVFMPESFALTGVQGNGGYYFNTAFLNKNTWNNLLNTSQPVDLSALGEKGIKFGDATLGRGFLFKQEDWQAFDKTIENSWRSNFGYGYYMPDNLPILGIGNVNGELAYIRQTGYTLGKDTVHTAYFKPDGSGYYAYTTKAKGAKGVAQKIAKTFADIPFAPEILGFASGSPAVYASLKGLQTVGAGGDLGDALKSAAIAYAGAKIAANVADFGKSLGGSIEAATGLSTGVSNFMGGAVVGSTANGVMAAVTGADVETAMLAGAVGGGLNTSASEFTSTALGGESNVASLAKAVNLKPEQLEQIFTGAVANGAISAAVYDKDFMETFSQSLITQGLSTSAANTVASSLDKNLSPTQRKIIVNNTRTMVNATTRAVMRGGDIDEALKAVAPKAVADSLSIGLRDALRNEKK